MSSLGEQKKKFLIHLQGSLPESRLREFAGEVISFAGMTPARRGRVDTYPYRGGGGVGCTGFFPLTESFLIIDTYDDLNEVELLLSTCKPDRVKLHALANFCACRIGPILRLAEL